jgi:hypothetical protein
VWQLSGNVGRRYVLSDSCFFSAEKDNVVRDALKARTGQKYVPFVFLDGKVVEGDALIEALRLPSGGPAAAKPMADAMFQSAGLRATGYYRP